MRNAPKVSSSFTLNHLAVNPAQSVTLREGSGSLESKIAFATLWLTTAQTPDERRKAFARLRDLISQRSPERVREMEQGIFGK